MSTGSLLAHSPTHGTQRAQPGAAFRIDACVLGVRERTIGTQQFVALVSFGSSSGHCTDRAGRYMLGHMHTAPVMPEGCQVPRLAAGSGEVARSLVRPMRPLSLTVPAIRGTMGRLYSGVHPRPPMPWSILGTEATAHVPVIIVWPAGQPALHYRFSQGPITHPPASQSPGRPWYRTPAAR